MTEKVKNRLAVTGLALGLVVFLLGIVMLCDCPCFFVTAALLTLAPILWAKPLVRLSAVCLCVISIYFAVVETYEMHERSEHYKQLRHEAK